MSYLVEFYDATGSCVQSYKNIASAGRCLEIAGEYLDEYVASKYVRATCYLNQVVIWELELKVEKP